MSIQKVIIEANASINGVEVNNGNTGLQIVEIGQGPAGATGATGPQGPAGPNSVTSATTSDGTCDLLLKTLQVGDDLTTSGLHSAAIGFECVASGEFSVATGNQTTASAEYSFATGTNTVASGIASFASGDSTTASEGASFAIGSSTTASGPFSFAGGKGSVASEEAAYAYGIRAKAIHVGASVESDSQDVDVESTATDEKTFRFANGYRFLGGNATFSAVVAPDEVKSSNFTAANGGSYTAVATLTVTDPTPSEGASFSVMVRNGTATVGGTAYSTAGSLIRRVFHSGSWQNYEYKNHAQYGTLATVNGGTGVATALAVNVGTSGAFVVNGGALGNPSSGNLANCTFPTLNQSTTGNAATATALQTGRTINGVTFDGTANITITVPVSTGITGFGTGVATALVVNTGTAGSIVVNGGALGTPSSGTLTSCTGLPISTGISGLGTGVATALANTANGTGGFVTTDGIATLTNKTLESATFTGTTMSRIHAMSMSQSPPFALFEDFNGALGAGVYTWTNSGTGSDAIGGIGPNVFGVRRMTTGGTSGNQRKTILPIPSASIFGTEIRAHFAIPDVTTCDAFIGMEQTAGAFGRYFLLYAAALNSGRWILVTGTGAGVFTNFGTNGPSNGNFTSGKRYRTIMRPINATTVYVKIEEADWNGSVWTVMHDANVTITSYTPSADPMALDIRVNTQTSATRSLEIDYISAENQTVTR